MTDQATSASTSESETMPTTESAQRAASGAAVVRRVEELAGRTEKKPVGVKDVVGALRAEPSVRLNLPDRQRIVQLLKGLDPDWSLILELACRSQATKDEILTRLGHDLIEEARRIAALPNDADTATVVNAVRAALQRSISEKVDGGEQTTQHLTPALVLTGLLAQRELPAFVDGAITVLEMSEKPGLERGREHLIRASVELVDQSAAKQRARALALLEPFRRRLARASADAARTEEELAALRQERERLRDELARIIHRQK